MHCHSGSGKCSEETPASGQHSQNSSRGVRALGSGLCLAHVLTSVNQTRKGCSQSARRPAEVLGFDLCLFDGCGSPVFLASFQ